MSCFNSGFVGYPVALLAAGPIAAVALALKMMVENLFKLPVLMALADCDAAAVSGTPRGLGAAR